MYDCMSMTNNLLNLRIFAIIAELNIMNLNNPN